MTNGAYFEFFCDISHSRIDNGRLNFTLDTPGGASELKNSQRALEKIRYAFD
jgi:hypothetical protein